MYSLNVNTITNAQRAAKLLKREGISASIGRERNPNKSKGCGYTVRLESDNIKSVIDYLNNNGVKVEGVVRE